jgi:hypothetical protein
MIFSTVRDLLKTYSPPLVVKVDESGRYDLVSIKDVVITGRKRSEVYFASIIIQKGYVGFYYMPIYSQPDMGKFFPPELLSLLKGEILFSHQALG